MLFDRKDEGQATDAAAGIICPYLSQRRNKAWYSLSKAGARYYPELIAALHKDGEQDTGYQNVGAVSLSKDIKKLEKMKERAEKRREDAPEIGRVKMLNEDETRSVIPFLRDDVSSVHIEGASRVDGRKLRDALLSAGKKRGVKIMNESADFHIVDREVKGVRAGAVIYEADMIIVAAGAYANELFSPLQMNMKVRGQKAQIVHLQIQNEDTDSYPVIMPEGDQYIVPFENGRIVVGATHEDEHDHSATVTAGGVLEVLQKATATAPALNSASLTEVRVGFRPYTPGFLPMIGEVPGHPNIIAVNGLGASGLTVGPYLGKVAAALVYKEDTEIDVRMYGIEEAFSLQ